MLRLATADEYGIRFETGLPVQFHYVRNTEGAPRPGFIDKYQQKLEPYGRYMIHNPDPGDLPRGWEKGIVRLRSPLVLWFNLKPGAYYDNDSWKAQLFKRYRKRGRLLTQALQQQGYDGIVTVMPGTFDTREIVELFP